MFKSMKLLIALSLLIVSLSACKTQPQDSDLGDTLTAGFDIKGDSVVLGDDNSGKWITNYKTALATAKSENKVVLIDFTGSDWCGWCVKLDKEVFSQDAFIAYAKQNLVLLKLDFPRSIPQTPEEKAQNQALAEQYKIKGYPTIILLDSNGTKIGETGYQPGGAASYVNHIKSFVK